MAKTDKSNKKGTSKRADLILAKAAALAKPTPKKVQANGKKISSASSDDSSDSSSAAVDSSDDSSSDSSSEESSSEESDASEKGTVSVPVKTTPVAVKKAAHASDDSDDSSSSEDSSSENSDGSDSDGEVDDKPPAFAETALAEANKKRKADSEAAALPKKVKLVNDTANVLNSSEETRSIFVGRLSWNVDNDWLAQEFAECGEVESAHVQMDRNTGRSRGFGYVHFKTADAVEKAIAWNGREIDGRAVNIDKSNPPDKKTSTEKRAQAFGDTSSPPSADTLWETFGEHGDVKSVRVPTDRETGKPKGFAYVEFSEVAAAKGAHAALQGFELDGRSIRLDFSQPRDGAGGRGGGQVR
ncbi:hypothetical protein J3R82DRAFT_3802 [Butyriboletus roseoflavus]|nr:hypothetical protein J3R82DRAFT_3802 [Butyriboletus roseoflavus]